MGEITFEASPRYYVYTDLVPFFYQMLPCARIVIALREPLSRAQSHYWHDTCTAGAHYRTRLKRRNAPGRSDGGVDAGSTDELLTFTEVMNIELALYDRSSVLAHRTHKGTCWPSLHHPSDPHSTTNGS